jgi:hypothetical protein
MYLSVITFAFFIGCLVYRGWHKDKPVDPADGLYAPYKPHMSLIERWRDEERRMAEAEEAAADESFCEDELDDDEVEPDEPAITFCEIEDEDESLVECLFCGASANDPEDDAFCEKELSRLYKVRSGLETKAARMRYVWQADDMTISADARKKQMERLQATKAWRGLQFDMNYVTAEINGIEDYLKRTKGE